MARYVLSLNSRSALHETRAGGKGASLAWLRRAGFRVPPGFVITPSAFHDFLLHHGLQDLAHRRNWSAEELDQRRKLFMAHPIPPALSRPITKAYRALGGCVAVRSSMVGEDTALASFAGQLDTILEVQGDSELLEAVKQCWASVFNWRLFKYMDEREPLSPEPFEGFSIAVVVQRMIEARAAGVAFSADPITGQQCVVIESVHGLGEALVQGLVEPDRHVVDAQGVLLETAAIDGRTPSLSAEQVLHLAEIVGEVASKMNGPQDVEWAWDGAYFFLLQSRPISTLSGQRVYSANMVSDMLPGLIKPLVWSVSTTSKLENVLGRVFTELVGASDVDFRQLAKRIHSRIYADTTLIGQLLEEMGLPANFFEVMSRDASAERRGRPPLNLRTLRTLSRLARFGWRCAWMADEINAFIEQHDRELEPYRQADWSCQSPARLLAHAEDLAGLYSETMWFNFVGHLNMMGRNRMMNRLVRGHAPDVPPTDIIRGLTGLKSLETNQALQRLAAQARTLGPGIPALLMEQDEACIRAGLSTTNAGRVLADGVDEFLDRFGFMSACGTDLSRTPWSEDPTVIWRSIGRLATQPATRAAQHTEQMRREAQTRVRANLNPLQCYAFDRLLRSTTTYLDLRERSSFLISEDSCHLRCIYLALADHLVAQGDLDQRDDVFYLAHDELSDLVQGDLAPLEARARIAERRAEMAIDAGLSLPDIIYGDHVPARPVLPAEGEACLEGISGSSGLVEGYARIILDPVDAHAPLGLEDILVIPFADTSWTPLFYGVGGIVAETGGQLSHSAIVAREYGLPAVVNVKNATRLIHEGQHIVVDGNRGRVVLSEG